MGENMGFLFVVQSAALGVGLAMDAFSVSMANGLACPHMSRGSMGKIAGTFAFFQFLMPMLGWLAVHMLVQYFEAFEKAIPWITLFLLGYIGIKMIWEGIHRQEDQEAEELSGISLAMQGIATSIDALSTGFAFASFSLVKSLAASLIIALVTFLICAAGVLIGRRFGMKLADKAAVFGGLVLVVIGLLIFLDVF